MQPFLPNKAISRGLSWLGWRRSHVDRDRHTAALGLQPLQLVQGPEQAALEG